MEAVMISLRMQVDKMKRSGMTREEIWLDLDARVLRTAFVWAKSYCNDPEKAIEKIGKLQSATLILRNAYGIMVSRKKLLPVEALSPNDYQQYMDELKNWPGLVEISLEKSLKVIYVLFDLCDYVIEKRSLVITIS